MAKKTAEKKPVTKKPRRRLKRTARRSLAAVLMITAVVVAAIPVPENRAEDDETSGGDESVGVIYAYDTTKYKDNLFDTSGVSLKRPTITVDGKEVEDKSAIKKTHYIYDDDGTWRMEWKYEFFEGSVNDDTKGIICGYNPNKPEFLLKVPKNPVYNYLTVRDKLREGEVVSEKIPTFEDFIEDAKTAPIKGTEGTEGSEGGKYWREFTCSAYPDAEVDQEDKKFQKYFPLEFQAQVNKGNLYKSMLDQFKSANKYYTDEELAAWKEDNKQYEPVKIVKKTSEHFTNANEDYSWRLYYCDAVFGYDDYILEIVADSDRTTAQGGSPQVYSYVPKRIDLTNKSNRDDDNGFRIDNWATFVGIGDEAFGTKDPATKQAVQNVKNIDLPEDMMFIGDYAFAGSFIESITMVNITNVGNYAFKECPNLTSVVFQTGVTNIGKEAFYGVQNLKEIIFPGTAKYIGPAAFAECSELSTVDFSKVSTPLIIDDYAFYNDTWLSKLDFVRAGTAIPQNSDNKPYEKPDTVSVVGLGKGAFAVSGSVKGNLTEFLIPSGIKINESDATGTTSEGLGRVGEGLGDYLLAGRTNLQTVVMSENYGSSSPITLPNDLFFNCISLRKVIFPSTGNSCGFVQYKSDLFDTVSNPDFEVWGPKYLSPSNKAPAYPRESTWAAESAVSDTIPYVYFENGVKYVEVSNDIYLQCIDDNGILISCVLRPGAEVPPDGIDLPIWPDVAGITVKGIKDTCFSDNTLNQAVKTLTILDGSELVEIGNSVFAGWEKLQKVYIGDSVRHIGNGAFLNDKNLEDVIFNTPESVAATAGSFTVGEKAFMTTGLELTFHGPITGNFEPYKQAVSADNYIDEDTKVRICYKSLAPSNLTVMYDNASGQVTLLDYPKYEDAATILGEFYATKKGVNWKKWKMLDKKKATSAAEFYRDWMERDYYAKYSGEQYDTKREAFAKAWANASDEMEVYNNNELYGPWISPYYCDNFGSTTGGTGTGTGGGGGDISGNSTEGGGGETPEDPGTSKVLDWLFEPITAYAMSGAPKPYFSVHPYDVYQNYDNAVNGAQVYGLYQTSTGDELDVFDATQYITVPDGVTSIDAKGFLDALANTGNKNTYFTVPKLGAKTLEMYSCSKGSGNNYQDREKDIVGGLFSGMYEDYGGSGVDWAASPEETLAKGNDRLKSINLNGVTSLPEYAFDNCENLNKVTIGKDCMDIGTLPFRGCTSLTNVEIAGDNPKYLVERSEEDLCKRIIYSRNGAAENGDTLYKIEECLETRGEKNNSALVDSAYDNLIPKVNALAEGAFAYCDYVEDVNLTDASHLKEIPKRSFMDCDNLVGVYLPSSVNKIEEYAFYNADNLGELQIPGREVSFTDYVFEDNAKSRTYVITYADSAARRYADTNETKYNLKWRDIGDVWEVKFFDMDGVQIGDTVTVDTKLTKEQIPPDPEREGYIFETWVGTGGITVEDYITGPTNFIAKYKNASGAPVDGKYVVEFHDGVTGEQLAGRGSHPDDGKYYVPVGTSFADNGWPEPSHLLQTGFEPAGFSSGDSSLGQWTKDTVVNGNLSIIALYKVAPNGGGTTNTSGNTTNTSGNSGNTGNTSNSSSNTSNSSTSTTSTTSGSTSGSSTTSSTSNGAGQYTVFVENGSGSGSYTPGTTVIIQASLPAAGMKFSNWTTDSNGVTLASASMPATTFTMPSNNVTVKANFVEDTGTAARTTGTNTADRDNGNTRVDIEKPGISNRDLATATVNGSTDNFIVKISETDEATRAVAAALTNKYGTLDNILYYAMDISLYDSTGTTKISDTTGLTVDITIPIPDSLVAYGGNNKAGAVVSGDQLENLNENFTTINGVPCIRFRATHFSPYTIYVDTGNLVEGMLDTTPKTGDPIHPKWFLSLGLACLSIILFMKKDRKVAVKA